MWLMAASLEMKKKLKMKIKQLKFIALSPISEGIVTEARV